MFCNENFDEYFNKCFEFTGNANWELPKRAYCSPSWSIQSLQQMKADLNAVKGQLNRFPLSDWSDHTKRTDPSSQIKQTIGAKFKIELLTQAWCKFYECLNAYQVIPELCLNNKKIQSLHLCEAPGAFISALNYHLYVKHRKVKWTWNANSLNPYFEGNSLSEMISDDSLIHQTLSHWEFGQDQTGDIRKFHNHRTLVDKFSNIDLVTADGSVDCMKDPGEQEHHVHQLHYCEIMTAFRVLREGGNFVLKLFTMYEHGTVCLMYLLNCCFKRVCVFKPCSSKSGNSEVYVLCFSFKGSHLLNHLWTSLLSSYENIKEDAMFHLSEINEVFLTQIRACAEYFMDLQCDQINGNIEVFGVDKSYEVWDHLYYIQENIAEMYLQKCRLACIPKSLKLLKRIKKKRIMHQDSDVTVINAAWQLNDDNLIKISTGCAIDVVRSSSFGCTSTKLSVSYERNSLPKGLAPKHFVISGACFDQNICQSVLHGRFFQMLMDQSGTPSDLIICGVPLLTRFLVGIIYILSLGFESLQVCGKGIMVFNNYNEFKFYIVRKHFERISSVYNMLEKKEYVEDILEVVSLDVLKKGYFYQAICKYNSEINDPI